MVINKKALILKVQKLNDKDNVVTFLTNNNVFAAISRGTRNIKSKNRFAIQEGNIVEIEFFPARFTNSLSKLKKAQILLQPSILKCDSAKVIKEIITLLLKINSSNPEVWTAINESWPYIGCEYNHYVETFVFARILKNIGILPVIDKCIICKNKRNISYFSFHEGGFFCSNCTPKKQDLNYLKSINKLFSNFKKYIKVTDKINEKILSEIKIFIRKYFYV